MHVGKIVDLVCDYFANFKGQYQKTQIIFLPIISNKL